MLPIHPFKGLPLSPVDFPLKKERPAGGLHHNSHDAGRDRSDSVQGPQPGLLRQQSSMRMRTNPEADVVHERAVEEVHDYVSNSRLMDWLSQVIAELDAPKAKPFVLTNLAIRSPVLVSQLGCRQFCDDSLAPSLNHKLAASGL